MSNYQQQNAQPQQQQYPPQYQQQPQQQAYGQPQQQAYGQPQQQQGFTPVNKPHNSYGATPAPATGAPLLSNEPQVGTPIYGDQGPPILKQKFVSQGYKDVWAAVLFLAQLIFMIALAGYNAHNKNIDIKFGSSDDSNEAHRAERYMAYAFFSAIALCLIAMAVMRAHAVAYIWGANILCICLWACLAIYIYDKCRCLYGFILILFAILHAVWLYFVRHRIPFAGVLLKYSVRTVTRNYGTIITSFIQLGFLILYIIGFVCMVVPTLNDLENEQCSDDNSSGSGSGSGCNSSGWKMYLIVCGFLLMWYWSVQVMTNVVHVTASGSVATWYFAGDDNMPPTPSLASCKRAMTTSFGSICFGSLLVAILKLIHTIVRNAARNGGFCACIAACIIGCIERLMEYFNVYAFTHVAIYGMSYWEAGKATWQMIKECGFAALFNDNLVYPVLTMTCLVNSIVIGVILGLAADSWVLGVICFLIAYVVHILILRVVYSGIVTIFVCVAECEDVLGMTNPEFYGQIQEAKATMRKSRC